MDDDLAWVKRQAWFYEFALPDGSRTQCYVPEAVRAIHATREKVLRHYLQRLGTSGSALDVACHEGLFSLVLAEHCASVTGIDRNPDSVEKARRISRLLGRGDIRFETEAIESWRGGTVDFVLCFGLLYHAENPIQIIRKLAALAGRALCIETQVLPYDISGRIEDGSYQWQRDLNGLFGVCADYPDRSEGGMTGIALVPSRAAVEFLLRHFGFAKIEVYAPSPGDYEQFVRGSRIIVIAER